MAIPSILGPAARPFRISACVSAPRHVEPQCLGATSHGSHPHQGPTRRTVQRCRRTAFHSPASSLTPANEREEPTRKRGGAVGLPALSPFAPSLNPAAQIFLAKLLLNLTTLHHPKQNTTWSRWVFFPHQTPSPLIPSTGNSVFLLLWLFRTRRLISPLLVVQDRRQRL